MGIRVTNLGYISTLNIEEALVSGSRCFKQIVYCLVLSPIVLTVGEASAQPTPTDVRSDTVRFYPEVYLGVKGGIRKTPLGVTTFVRDTTDASVVQVADVIFNVLRDDLRYSGRFDVLADSAIGDSTGNGSLLDIWSAAGARGLVRGEVRRTLDHTELFATLYRLPDGRLLIAKSYVVDLDRARSVAHRLNDDIIYSLLGQRGVALSQIAFVSKRNGDKEIFVMGYDGHGARQVTDDGTLNLSPEWSPDGKQIAFNSTRTGTYEIWTIHPDGSGLRQLTDTDDDANSQRASVLRLTYLYIAVSAPRRARDALSRVTFEPSPIGRQSVRPIARRRHTARSTAIGPALPRSR